MAGTVSDLYPPAQYVFLYYVTSADKKARTSHVDLYILRDSRSGIGTSDFLMG